MVLTEHRCGHFWHRNLAEAAECHQARTDVAATEALLSGPSEPLSDPRCPQQVAEMTLGPTVERSTRLLDRITFALAVVITPLALYFALQAIPYLFRAITTGRP